MCRSGDTALQAACGGCNSRRFHQFQIRRDEGKGVELRALEARESRCESCRRDHLSIPKQSNPNCKPRRFDPGLITLVTRSVTGACYHFMKMLIRQTDCKPVVTKHVGSRRVEHYHQHLPIQIARGVTVAHRIVNPRGLGANPSGRAKSQRKVKPRIIGLAATVLKTVSPSTGVQVRVLCLPPLSIVP